MSEMGRIDEIRARLDAVSQPWVMEWDGQTLYVNDSDGDEIVAQTFAIATWEPKYSQQKAACDTASAELIVNAPADIAYLTDRIAALEAENARLRAILEQLADVYHDTVHGVENSVEAMYACKRDWFCEEARAALAASAGEAG